MNRSPFFVLTALALASASSLALFGCRPSNDNTSDTNSDDDDDAMMSNSDDEGDSTSQSTTSESSNTSSTDSSQTTTETPTSDDTEDHSTTDMSQDTSEDSSDDETSGSDETSDETSTSSSTATGQDDAAACEVFASAKVEDLNAAASEDEAALVIVKPDPSKAYRVVLEEGKAGYITYEFGEWNSTQAFYVSKDVTYTVKVAGGDTQMDRTAVPMCADEPITEQLIHFDHWTPATLTFSENGPREVWLMVYKAP